MSHGHINKALFLGESKISQGHFCLCLYLRKKTKKGMLRKDTIRTMIFVIPFLPVLTCERSHGLPFYH